MTKVQSFQEDCIALAEEKLARGQMTRRQFNVAIALLGAGATSGAFGRDVFAQVKELV